MGAENSILKGCELGEPLNVSPPDWAIHPAKRPDGSKVTVFVNKHTENKEEEHLQNAARQLKILRHPTILKFFASCKNVEGTYLITEQVEPLELVLENLSPEEICAGLFNIAEALSFLHDRGGVSHNNVCVASIYVSNQDGGWRLGGMEHLCKFQDATIKFLNQSKKQRCSKAIPPEEKEENLKTTIAPSIGHARDAYGFGVLAQDMLELIGDLGEMTESFQSIIEDNFLNDDPKLRPRLVSVLGNKIFRNDFLDISRFLYNLTLKAEPEKNIFFEGLAARLFDLQEKLVATRLAPLLLTSFVIAEPSAVESFFPHFLSLHNELSPKPSIFKTSAVSPLLSETLFQQHLIPIIVRIFPSRELHVRHLLLQHFASYVNLIDERTLRKSILPQLLVGLKDRNNEVVSWSLRALAELVPILGADVVIGGERHKYFVEGRPKFPFKTRESTPKSGTVKHLTAVSGVITLPHPSPFKETTSPPKSAEKPSSDIAEVKHEKKAEQERRKGKMRLKNEQRGKERETRQEKSLVSKKEVVRLSSVKKDLFSADPSFENTKLSEEVKTTGVSPESSNSNTAQLDVTEEDDNADWSKWDNDEDGDEFEPIEMSNQNSFLSPSSKSALHQDNSDDVWEGGDWGRNSSDWSEFGSQSKGQRSTDERNSNSKQSPDNSKTLQDSISLSVSTAKGGLKLKETCKINQNSTTRQKTSPKKSENNQGFDGLFEVPVIKVKSGQVPETDFFADMEPTLNFSSSSTSLASARRKAIETDSSRNAESVKSPVSNFSFTVDNTEDTTDGWGEEDFDFDGF